jgi:hypothetical protein
VRALLRRFLPPWSKFIRRSLVQKSTRFIFMASVDWPYQANTDVELANIGSQLFTATKQNFLDEQVQMTRLLEALAPTSVVQFPIRVRHTGDGGVPDFQLEFGKRRIAVELAKIAVQDVEHARALQRRGIGGTLAISSLYRKKSKPRKTPEVVSEALLIPAFVFPVSVQEYAETWMAEAVNQIQEKSAVLGRDDFARGDENWLVLWDRIGTANWEATGRVRWFTELLSPIWKTGWYDKVILQEEHFQWHALFSPQEAVVLRSSG